MSEIRLLAVPYEVGAPRMGVGRDPDRVDSEGRVPPIALRLFEATAEHLAGPP